VDFTIKLKPDGTDETNAAADAIARVRDELEKTQKSKTKIDARPRAVREAKEDRELDRAAAKYQKDLIKYDREQDKIAQRQAAASAKKSAQESKESAKKTALDERRVSNEQKLAARSVEIEKKKSDADQKVKARAEAQRAKEDERKIAQLKKQQEREDKELERYGAKAQKDLIKAGKDDEKKAKQGVKDKDQSRAEKIDPGLKKLTETQKAVKSKFTDPAKAAIAGMAIAAGASLAGLAYKFAPLAMGYMGMARLSMISQQASFNMRRLFVGTNPKPLLDAIQRTGQLLDPRTFTGKTLGEFFVRSADGIFNFLSKAEPYVRLFFKGMLYGALQAEIAWLKLRIAIQPALNLLPNGIGLMTAFSAGALAIKASFGLMGVGIALGAVKAGGALLSFGRAALVATAPLLPYAAAIGAIALALGQAIELKKQWDENSAKQIKEKLKEDLGFTTQAEREEAFDKRNKSGKYYVDKPDVAKPVSAPMPKDASKQATAAGPPIGKNLGLGIVAGLEETKGKVASSARGLVQEAEKAAKDEAEIKSPAAKWRREIGRNLGEGAALGLDDSADRMDSAARAMMPGAPGIGGIVGRAGGGISIGQIGPFNGVDLTSARMIAREVRDALDNFAEQYGALA